MYPLIRCVHGSCQDGQSCDCDLGYEGDTCADKTCFLPCQHGGTCYEVSEGRSTCACTPDWQGSLCQEKKCTLQCVRGSCQYWPLKEDRSQQTSMYCNCPFGWTGDLCDEKSPETAGTLGWLNFVQTKIIFLHETTNLRVIGTTLLKLFRKCKIHIQSVMRCLGLDAVPCPSLCSDDLNCIQYSYRDKSISFPFHRSVLIANVGKSIVYILTSDYIEGI